MVLKSVSGELRVELQ